MKLKFLLQLGVAFALIYAGTDALIHPGDWIGFVPVWMGNFGFSIDLILKGHAIVEVLIGLMLLVGWQLRLFAALAALDVLAILVMNGFSRGVLLITFRDVSIFFTALYLALDKS